MLSWINQVASHLSPDSLPSWWKSVFAQDESRGGTDPTGKTSIILKQKQIPKLALSFLPLAPVWVCLLVWNNITVNQGYKNTEHSSLVWGIWSWSKSLLNKISKIEWNRICLTLPFFFPLKEKSSWLQDSWLGHYSSHKYFSYPVSQRPSTTLQIKNFYHDIFHIVVLPLRSDFFPHFFLQR